MSADKLAPAPAPQALTEREPLSFEQIDLIRQALLDTAQGPYDFEQVDPIVERILAGIGTKGGAPQAAPAPNRSCEYCDGTGDVHGLGGEWRGECGECPAAVLRDFKNFHRLLCDRFGYFHDERDWRRDQLSLIEFIAAPAPAPQALTDAQIDSIEWSCPETWETGANLANRRNALAVIDLFCKVNGIGAASAGGEG